MTRLVYFVRRALESMRRAPRVTFVATATIFIAVFLTGLFAGALQGAHRLLGAWAGGVQISVYLDPAADLAQAREAAAAAAEGYAVEAVPADEALRRFRAALGAQSGLLDGIEPGVLPPSIEVRAPGIGSEKARALAKRLEAVPGAREVDYGSIWLERLDRLLNQVRWAGGALFAALAVCAAVLVANTLRLGVFARRQEIEIMKLVGATNAFVGAPFLIEGMVQGVIGGVLASGALLATAAVALPRIAQALELGAHLGRGDLFSPTLLAALVGAGGALGLVASSLAVYRELRQGRS